MDDLKKLIAMMRAHKVKSVLIILVLLVVYVFVGGGAVMHKSPYYQTSAGESMDSMMIAEESYGMGAVAPMAVPEMRNMDGAYMDKGIAYDDGLAVPSVPPALGDTAGVERKVIQNASLSLFVSDSEAVMEAIKGIAEKYEGFIANASLNEYRNGKKSGYVTLRVPGEKFNPAITDIKDLAIRVDSESINADDVTEQFVDLEAQLRNYKAEEAQYLEIMKRAGEIKDVLQVTQQLSRVRGQIERIQGQLNYLSRRVALSTITVSITPEADVQEPTDTWKPISVMKAALKDALEELTDFVDDLLRVAIGLPIFLIKIGFWGLLLFMGIKLLVALKRKFIPELPAKSEKPEKMDDK